MSSSFTSELTSSIVESKHLSTGFPIKLPEELILRLYESSSSSVPFSVTFSSTPAHNILSYGRDRWNFSLTKDLLMDLVSRHPEDDSESIANENGSLLTIFGQSEQRLTVKSDAGENKMREMQVKTEEAEKERLSRKSVLLSKEELALKNKNGRRNSSSSVPLLKSDPTLSRNIAASVSTLKRIKKVEDGDQLSLIYYLALQNRTNLQLVQFVRRPFSSFSDSLKSIAYTASGTYRLKAELFLILSPDRCPLWFTGLEKRKLAENCLKAFDTLNLSSSSVETSMWKSFLNSNMTSVGRVPNFVIPTLPVEVKTKKLNEDDMIVSSHHSSSGPPSKQAKTVRHKLTTPSRKPNKLISSRRVSDSFFSTLFSSKKDTVPQTQPEATVVETETANFRLDGNSGRNDTPLHAPEKDVNSYSHSQYPSYANSYFNYQREVKRYQKDYERYNEILELLKQKRCRYRDLDGELEKLGMSDLPYKKKVEILEEVRGKIEREEEDLGETEFRQLSDEYCNLHTKLRKLFENIQSLTNGIGISK